MLYKADSSSLRLNYGHRTRSCIAAGGTGMHSHAHTATAPRPGKRSSVTPHPHEPSADNMMISESALSRARVPLITPRADRLVRVQVQRGRGHGFRWECTTGRIGLCRNGRKEGGRLNPDLRGDHGEVRTFNHGTRRPRCHPGSRVSERV